MKDRSVGSCSKSSAFAPCCLLLSLTPAARPATHNHPNLTSQITPSSTPASIEHSPTLSTPTIMTSAHRTSPAEHIVTTIESARTSDEIPISLNKICGRTPLLREARIVGGTEARFGEFPWQASLREVNGSDSQHFCGATLVHPKWATTTAHCAERAVGVKVVIRFGAYDFENLNPVFPHKNVEITQWIIHPNYNQLTKENDLAMLRLSGAIKIEPHIIPICLAPYKNYTGANGIITGWGRLSNILQGGELPTALHKVQVPFVSNKDCRNWYRDKGHKPAYVRSPCFICAGYKEGGRDSCQGDSGGPVVGKIDGRWALIGITRGGVGCALPNLPGVDIFVPFYAEWINQISNGDVYLPEFYVAKYGYPPLFPF